ncbi:MAG TPA: RNA polymerase sigma factor SigI [Bacilli bacterium]
MLLVLFKRFLGKREFHHPADGDRMSLEVKLSRIRQGDVRLRNQVIADYQPYIAKVTSKFCKRYIDPARDDEFSVALDAFNEAINKFSAEAGASFLSFAETVIRRRLIDYIRKEQRFSRQVPYSAFEVEDDEDSFVNPVEIAQSLERYKAEQNVAARRLEIEELSASLAQYGISFQELVRISPKHSDSRRLLVQIGSILSNNDELLSQLRNKKMLPIKELLEKVDISRKTLERHRKYIIAIALIDSGPYPHLQNYLHTDGGQQGGEENE